MPHTINERIRGWSRDAKSDVEFLDVKAMIDYLARILFADYEPMKMAGSDRFDARLRDWLNGWSDEEDQKVLLQLVPKLFFVGQKEFDSLYQMAFNGPIARWLIDQLSVKLNDSGVQETLRDEVKHTWFCPITDSMMIAKFHHVNNITGANIRPDWRSLNALMENTAVAEYMRENDLRRVVLLEDFVGTGDQMAKAVEFAVTLPRQSPKKPIPVLVCPIVVCPGGVERGEDIQRKHSHVRFATTLALPRDAFITPDATEGDPAFASVLRDVLKKLYGVVSGKHPYGLYGPFGYRNTGALVVMYTNCPDNVPPIIHYDDSETWTALFPRSSRL